MNTDKKLILEMLREGKLTSEEAEKLLDAIDEVEAKKKANQTNGNEENQNSFYKNSNGKKFEFDSESLEKILRDAGEKLDAAASKIDKEKIETFGNTLGTTLLGFGKDLGIAFVDIVGGIKDIPNNFKSNTESITTTKEFDLSEIENPKINLKAINGGVDVVVNEEDSFARLKIVCAYKAQEVETGDSLYNVYLENDELIFTPKYTNVNIKIEASIPEKDYESVKLATKNGSIRISDITGNILCLESVNGSLNIFNSTFEKSDVSTVNSKILVEDSEFDEINGNTTNARIELYNLTSKKADFRTSNGKVIVDDSKIDDLVLKTSNASSTISNIQSEKIYLSTSNGKVNISDYDEDFLQNLEITTSNAPITIETIPNEKAVSFDLETSMGHININKDNLVYVKNVKENYGMKKILAKSLDFDNADEKIVIKATTANGSIEIG